MLLTHRSTKHDATLQSDFNQHRHVLQLDTILRTAKRVGKPLPTKPRSKNQKNFSKMIRMECQLEGVGKVKLLLGIKKKTGEMVQYCITVLEQQ